VTRVGARRPGDRSIAGRMMGFVFSKASRLALGLSQSDIQWVTGALSPGKAAGA
jgi:hypothetical protein